MYYTRATADISFHEFFENSSTFKKSLLWFRINQRSISITNKPHTTITFTAKEKTSGICGLDYIIVMGQENSSVWLRF